MIFCLLLEIVPGFPNPEQEPGDFSSNKLHRQLCMHYEHSSQGIRGCRFEEEALYFEFSKTQSLSNPEDTIVLYCLGTRPVPIYSGTAYSE
jgi:hypothetical protein